ncbi:MAG: phosphatase PAP2 family protein [Verrucomicrobiota bacterium]
MSQASRRFTAYKWACGLIAAAVQSAIYFGIGHARLSRSTELLRTRADDAIPFLPATAWFYLPVYAAIFIIAIAGFRSRAYFDRALRGVALVMVVGFLGHLLVGAEYPRPVLAPPYPDLSSAFLAWVQRIDPPGNVFPSLHVAHSSTLALILNHENPRLGRWVIALAALLAASTLTTKQHFVADVVAGLALAALARWLVLRGSSASRGLERIERPPV